jgi:hypothetical protein
MPKLPFYFGQMIMPNGLIAFCPLWQGFFLGRRRLQNLLNFQPFGSSISRPDRAGG